MKFQVVGGRWFPNLRAIPNPQKFCILKKVSEVLRSPLFGDVFFFQIDFSQHVENLP